MWAECNFPSSFHCTDFYGTCNGIEWRFSKVNFSQIDNKKIRKVEVSVNL